MIIKSLEQLNSISNKVADRLKENDYIYLIGEIGVGKTTFTRTLINYFQKKEGVEQTEVLSPTFNILYEYNIKKLKIMHYDLYRIKDKKELEQLGVFQQDQDSIKIIEWPELVEINLADRLELHLNYFDKENERELSLIGHGKWKDINKNEL